MFPPLVEAADKRVVALSAFLGVLLVVSAAWKARRWTGHEPASEAQPSAEPSDHAIDQPDATGQTEPASLTTEKRHSSSHHEHRDHNHHHHHHHRHAKSLSPTGQGTYDPGETEHHLYSRAQTQPNYSGFSNRSHGHQEDSKHSPRILPFHDTHDEPTSLSLAHPEEAEAKRHRDSGLYGSRASSDPHQRHDHSSHSTHSTYNQAGHGYPDDFREKLQSCIDEHFIRHPEDRTYWEEELESLHEHRAPRDDQVAAGKRYRDLALREARLRKEAFENSKRAFKLGRKAEAKQLSDEGKLHDGNVKRYNAHAASEIFAANNPRYDSGRWTRCDLHGLHVEEAMVYARNHLIACRNARVDKTMLIVGKGSHSQQGGARIRPAILSMLSEVGGVVAGVHEKNEGCIVVDFAVGR